MKVLVKIIEGKKLKTIIHKGIGTVLWEDSWVRLVPINSQIQCISYRKEMVFAVIEEKDNRPVPVKITDLR